jgi:hypothetical protein
VQPAETAETGVLNRQDLDMRVKFTNLR